MSRIVRAIVITGFGLVAAYLIWYWACGNHSQSTDFLVYRDSAQVLVDHGQLYLTAPGHWPFIYPPFAAVLFVPFLVVGPQTGFVVFTLITVACWAIISYLCATQ